MAPRRHLHLALETSCACSKRQSRLSVQETGRRRHHGKWSATAAKALHLSACDESICCRSTPKPALFADLLPPSGATSRIHTGGWRFANISTIRLVGQTPMSPSLLRPIRSNGYTPTRCISRSSLTPRRRRQQISRDSAIGPCGRRDLTTASTRCRAKLTPQPWA